MSTSRRGRVALATTAAALTVALSGCGVTGTGFQPGVAAKVDDRTVSTDHVDELVSLYCDAIDDQFAAEDTVVPFGYLRTGVAGELTLKLAAEQLAEDYGVEPTADYDRAVSDIESQITELSDDEQEAVLEVATASAYVAAVQIAVGEVLLADEGVTDPASEEAGPRGVEAFNEWLDDHEVVLNPEYGATLKDGALAPDDTELSFPVGETAKQGRAEQPDPAYAKGLPESQRCG